MNIYSPLEEGLGDWIDNSVVVDTMEAADIVLLPGGSDVNPTLYGHSALPTTFINQTSDGTELALLGKSILAKKFIIGICKGSQMLTVASGGWLIQDITGHHNHHEIETHDGKKLTVNSSHHQMCYPYDLPDEDYELLAWAGESHTYTCQENRDVVEEANNVLSHPRANTPLGRFKEPEIIFYPKIRGLGIQSHPEWGSMPEEFNGWVNELILKLI